MKNLKIIILILFALIGSARAQSSNDQYVKIETRLGVMIFKLSAETPKHTANFIKLAKKGYFDTYDFNRVIKGFVAQGGETDSAYAAMEKNGVVLERIAPEFNPKLFHQKGALAAGRDDNKEKTSFLGQFYVVDGKKYNDSTLNLAEKRIGNNFHFSPEARKVYKEIGGVANLDQNYTVFGKLVKGWEVLAQIMSQEANKAGLPANRIGIKVSVLSKKEIAKL